MVDQGPSHGPTGHTSPKDGHSDTGAWYKNFIVITIVPHQNYSSTNIIIQKIDSLALNPTFCTRREAPSIERRGLSESSNPSHFCLS